MTWIISRIRGINNGDDLRHERERDKQSFGAEEIPFDDPSHLVSSLQIEQHNPINGTGSLSTCCRDRGYHARDGDNSFSGNVLDSSLQVLNADVSTKAVGSSTTTVRTARDVGRAQYPGAVRVRGIDATEGDDEATIAIGEDHPSQASPCVVEQTELYRGQSQSNRPSSNRTSVDQMGRYSEPSARDDGNHDTSRRRRRSGPSLMCSKEWIIALLATGAVALIPCAIIIATRTKRAPRSSTPAPTPSPPSSPMTTFQSVLSAEIIGTVNTFGFAVDLNDLGTRMAVAAPGAHSGRGQVEVYELTTVVEASSTFTSPEVWTRLGEPIVGYSVGDEASFGMDLSLDGNVLAVGYPGNKNGSVRVFEYSSSSGEWTQKGQTLAGPSLDSHFGAAVSLNRNGTNIAIGAPHAGDQEQGMFEAYSWYGTRWLKRGALTYGQSAGDRFGASIGMSQSGDTVVIGAPNRDVPSVAENVGMVQIFKYVASAPKFTLYNCSAECWVDISKGSFLGHKNESRFGRRISSLEMPLFSYFFVASSWLAHNDQEVGRYSEDLRYIYLRKDSGDTGEFPITRDDTQHQHDEGFGYDLDVDDEFWFLCATTLNNPTQTGLPSCFGFLHQSDGDIGWDDYFADHVAGPLQLGEGTWLGTEPNMFGPSVAVTVIDGTAMLATGYQSVIIRDGEDVPGVVRIFRVEVRSS